MGNIRRGAVWRRGAALAACLALGLGAGLAEGERLIPGGQLVGVAVETKGLIYVGASDLGSRPSPAREAGLKMGDVIETANGREIRGVKALTEMLSAGNALSLGVVRAGKPVKIAILPQKDPRDGAYRMGAWVRESTAGVGTLTYINPQTGEYGALGHAIADPDTQTIVPVREGALYASDAAGVVPGRRGSPGELAGDFIAKNQPIGTLLWNAPSGIGGVYTPARAGSALFPAGLPAASASEIVPGWAQIISTVDENGPRLFDIAILSVDANADTRNLTLKILDDELLSVTGGIVQGMSGSPIVQNGKLVGAVTHVFVNDPARGYGIGIQQMLLAAAEARAQRDAA